MSYEAGKHFLSADNDAENDGFGKGKQELAEAEITILRERGKEFEGRLMVAILEGNTKRIEGLRNSIASIKKRIAYYENNFHHPPEKPIHTKQPTTPTPVVPKIPRKIIPIRKEPYNE
jgi:hypothetical protein